MAVRVKFKGQVLSLDNTAKAPSTEVYRNKWALCNGHVVQKTHHAGEQAMCWDIHNKENSSLAG